MAAADSETSRLDEAARAGWLYFIAGHTQDEIARMLQISRASAQRLVSLCLSERLITFRLEHPIAACMELAARLKDAFKLAYCEVVPSDPAAPQTAAGIAERAANVLELMLRSDKPVVVALGTGRAVRAAVERALSVLQDGHDHYSGFAVREGPAPGANTIDEMPRLEGQRLGYIDLRCLRGALAQCDVFGGSRRAGFPVLDRRISEPTVSYGFRVIDSHGIPSSERSIWIGAP